MDGNFSRQKQRSFLTESEGSLRDFLTVVFNHKWKIMFSFVAINFLVITATFLSAEIYESSAKVIVRMGRDPVNPSSMNLEGSRVFQNFSEKVQSEVAILNNQELIESVVEMLTIDRLLARPDEVKVEGAGAQNDLREVRKLSRQSTGFLRKLMIDLDLVDQLTDQQKAVSMIKNSLEVSVLEGSNIIELHYEGQNPNVVQQVLQALLTLYMEQHLKIHTASASPSFFQRQVEDKGAELKSAEDELHNFNKENNIAELDKQVELLLGRQDDLQNQIDESVSLADAAKAKVDSLRHFFSDHERYIEVSRTTGKPNRSMELMKDRWLEALLKKTAPNSSMQTAANGIATNAKDQLMDLRLKRAELLSRYLPQSRELTEVNEQITIIESFLGSELTTFKVESSDQVVVAKGALEEERGKNVEVTTGIDATFLEVEKLLNEQMAEHQGHKARTTSLRSDLARVTQELETFAILKTKLRQLNRELEIFELEYTNYREGLQQSLINAALDKDKISNVSIVQAPSFSLGTIRPKKMRNIALGFIMAIFLSLSLAFFMEYFDQTLRSVHDIEKNIGVPVLASISADDFNRCAGR